MAQPSTPRDYALTHLCRLESLWSAVHDADVFAVHDARVATRRVRAAVPFVSTAAPAVTDELRRIGRALGRVRELDSMNELLHTLEPRVVEAAAAIGIARREVDGRLSHHRRRLIKKLRHRPRSIARAIAGGVSAARFSSLWRSWRHEVRNAVRERAVAAESALDRATAVHMPNRAHSARIALKKLRYLIEVAVATGVVIDASLIGALKDAQEALGALHDMTVLGRFVDNVRFPGDVITESQALTAVVRAETARLHERYVRRRERIRAACDACLRAVDHEARAPLAIPAAAVVAIPVLASWYFRQTNENDSPDVTYQLTS
jgi:CHAD domain-containing protein